MKRDGALQSLWQSDIPDYVAQPYQLNNNDTFDACDAATHDHRIKSIVIIQLVRLCYIIGNIALPEALQGAISFHTGFLYLCDKNNACPEFIDISPTRKEDHSTVPWSFFPRRESR